MTDAYASLAQRLSGDGAVLLFGGTFDPPHRAHVELPLLVREKLGASWLVYIPAGRSPHKDDGPSASGDDRVAMLEAALDGRAGVLVSRVEIEAPEGPSYTVRTLGRLRDSVGEDRELRLLIGADQARSFHRWREHERVADLAEPVVMLRAPQETKESLLKAMSPFWSTAGLADWEGRVVGVPLVDVSATRLRELLALGDFEHPGLAEMLPASVLAVIRERRLYGPRP